MKGRRWPESGLTAGDADHIVNLDLVTRQQIDDLRRTLVLVSIRKRLSRKTMGRKKNESMTGRHEGRENE